MKEFSNRYIFLYITTLVFLTTLLLTGVHIGLKPRQEANKKIEKAQQILRAAGYGDVDKSVAADKFNAVATPIERNEREAYAIRCADNTNGTVVEVHGKGLWGPIWGYVVLADDQETIKGVVFAHKSETPGLGDKITQEKFTSSFIGKKIVDQNGNFVSVRVLQKGKDNSVAERNRVDAISGATLTSKGVDKMLKDCLTDK